MSDAPLSNEQATLFRVSHFGEIVPVQLVKRTASFVTYAYKDWMGRHAQQREAADRFFSTWEEANQSLIDKCQREIDWCKQERHRLESKLGQLKKAKAPQ